MSGQIYVADIGRNKPFTPHAGLPQILPHDARAKPGSQALRKLLTLPWIGSHSAGTGLCLNCMDSCATVHVQEHAGTVMPWLHLHWTASGHEAIDIPIHCMLVSRKAPGSEKRHQGCLRKGADLDAFRALAIHDIAKAPRLSMRASAASGRHTLGSSPRSLQHSGWGSHL